MSSRPATRASVRVGHYAAPGPNTKESRRMRLACPLIVSALIAVASGCGSDPRPKYVAPELPPDQLVSVRTTGGLYIDGVDGAKLGSAGLNVLGMGGHTVKLRPGERNLSAWIQSGQSTARFNFNHTFEAGTEYAIGPDNAWFPRNVKITNLKTQAATTIR